MNLWIRRQRQTHFSAIQWQDKRQQTQTEGQKILSEQNKNHFYSKVVEHWDRLPKEVVESTTLEVFKTHMDKFLSNLP